MTAYPQKTRGRIGACLTLGLLSLSLHAAPAWALKSSEAQSDTVVEIIDRLEERHYSKQKFDDEMSSRYLDKYIEMLDPSRSYFFAGDIEGYEKYRTRFDDDLKKGDLKIPFEMYDRLYLHMKTRLSWLIGELESEERKFDFSKDEKLLIDRAEAPWPVDKASADAIWTKRLKGAILSLMLAGKSEAEARETLVKRYTNQLNRISQRDQSDAFELMVNALTLLYDPHTSYHAPRTMENFDISMRLSLEGIGAVLQTEDEHTKVVKLVAGGPAFKQGDLKVADKIISVGQGENGELVDVIGWRLDEVVKLIRGPKTTTVRLELLRKGQEKSRVVAIRRDQVKLEDQAASKRVMEVSDGEDIKKVGVIDIPTFYMDFDAWRRGDPNYRSTTSDVYRLIQELEKEQIDGLIIDLRNNGGGSLIEATNLTDLFIDPGPVVQIRHKSRPIDRRQRSRQRAYYTGPVVVLINRLSASASEIFAGAIQDYQRGLVVGSQSFGKGTVQTLTPLEVGQLKVTESKFYRVSGDSTQHRGVHPDIELPAMVDKSEVGESSYDNALPWDQIHAVAHSYYFPVNDLAKPIAKQHQERIKADPDFIYLQEQRLLMDSVRNQTYLSLNKADRLAERETREAQQLAIENKRRGAKGLEPLKELDGEELDDEKLEGDLEANEQAASDDETEEPDPLLAETGNILLDFSRAVTERRAAKLEK